MAHYRVGLGKCPLRVWVQNWSVGKTEARLGERTTEAQHYHVVMKAQKALVTALDHLKAQPSQEARIAVQLMEAREEVHKNMWLKGYDRSGWVGYTASELAAEWDAQWAPKASLVASLFELQEGTAASVPESTE